MSSGMKIKSIAPWFGSKRSMAADIVTELGPHRAYFDCFAGSLAVPLAKPESSHETVNDLHGDVINLARVLASDDAVRLYERLSRVICCEPVFDEARVRIAEPFEFGDTPSVARAFDYFLVSWIGRNGVAGTERIDYQMAVRWTPGGGHGGVRFTSAVESIPAWHRRLRRMIILCRDGFEILEKIDDVEGVAIYLDPPYLRHTRGGCRYAFDFDDVDGGLFGDDHTRLARCVRRFKRARVVISYYDAPRLRDLYPPDQFTYVAKGRQKNLHVQNRRGMGKLEAPEVLILNGPSYAAGHAR